MFYSRILGLTVFCYYVTVGVARTRVQSLDLKMTDSSVTDTSPSPGSEWHDGSTRTVRQRKSMRRKKTERRNQLRHSTRVDRNRPTLVLLPPLYESSTVDKSNSDKVTTMSTTSTTTTTNLPFIINVPFDSIFQNETTRPLVDVRVPDQYLAPPLVDSISEYQLAPEPELSISESANPSYNSSTTPGTTSSTTHVYMSTTTPPTTMVTLSVLLGNNPNIVSDNCTYTPCQNMELSYYTFPLEMNNDQTSTPAMSENDLSAPLIVAESGDIRNSRYRQRQRYRENHVTSNKENQNPTKIYQKQHKHPRHVCTEKGYVADISSGCQVFHICVDYGVGESMACPNGTLFNKDFSVCDWWYNVDCK